MSSAVQPHQLMAAMDKFSPDNLRVFHHPGAPGFVYTEGLRALVQTAKAHWLLDLVAERLAPVYARAWQNKQANTAQVTLEVGAPDKLGQSAQLDFRLDEDATPQVIETIGFLDFPVGTWLVRLWTNELADGSLVTTAGVNQEY